MTSGAELAAARQRYAEELRYVAHVRSDAVVRAFAAVPRERFLGPGPWRILDLRGDDYWLTPDADPAHLYHNVLVAIDPARRLNNGEPSLWAFLFDVLAPRPGERARHIGAGTGYYSAILAELVGAGGRVEAIEADPALAERARANLAPWPQVRVDDGRRHRASRRAGRAHRRQRRRDPSAGALARPAARRRAPAGAADDRERPRRLSAGRAPREGWPARFVSFVVHLRRRPAGATPPRPSGSQRPFGAPATTAEQARPANCAAMPIRRTRAAGCMRRISACRPGPSRQRQNRAANDGCRPLPGRDSLPISATSPYKAGCLVGRLR